MKLRSIKDLKELKNKRVLLRVDFNVPLKKGKILDETRIKASLPTINYLLERKAKIILISHLGDPKKFKSLKLKIKNCSLRPIVKSSTLRTLGLKIKFIDDYKKAKEIIEKMEKGEIALLENLRFNKGEEKNDLKFARDLSKLADIYVNDAFACSHRGHASLVGITKFLPSYAGLLLEKEVINLSQVLEKPQKPFIAIIGGAKISTKAKTIQNLLRLCENILIGGALANDFLEDQGYNVSKSLVDKEYTLAIEKEKLKKIILPVDFKIKDFKTKKVKIVELFYLPFLKNDFAILDIGPKTISLFRNHIKKAKTIVYNGPMGYFEEKKFAQGTVEITKAILKNRKAKIIIGGGETIAAFKALKLKFKPPNVFISTGGGAMLEFLEGKILPGIKPLIKT